MHWRTDHRPDQSLLGWGSGAARPGVALRHAEGDRRLILLLAMALQSIGAGSSLGGEGVRTWCAAFVCEGRIRDAFENALTPDMWEAAIRSGATCAAGDVECAGPDPVLAWRPEPSRFEPFRLPVAIAAGSGAMAGQSAAAMMEITVAGEAHARPVRRAENPDQLYEYSDGFYARLALHRIASYGTLPLFVAQYFAGEELLRNVDHAAGWARAIHGPAAAGVAGLFLVNTVTGGMNVVEGIRDPADRGRRTVHSLLMLIAEAGFVWTGVTASGAGRYKPDSNELRTTHRKVALGSMGVATLGYLIMIPPFRK